MRCRPILNLCFYLLLSSLLILISACGEEIAVADPCAEGEANAEERCAQDTTPQDAEVDIQEDTLSPLNRDSWGGQELDTLQDTSSRDTLQETSPADTSQDATSTCGDGVAEALEGERCDGEDLDGLSCQTLGFTGGPLRCTEDCALDTSGCSGQVCGDGSIQGDEVCDAQALGGANCFDFGFNGGTLQCSAQCQFDASACLGSGRPPGWSCDPDFYGSDDGCDCGCGVVDPDCDTPEFDACQYCSGSGSCSDDADGCSEEIIDPLNNATCLPSRCADGLRSPGEICDGADLQGESCTSLGFNGGTLSCTTECDFNTTLCSGVDPDWTCAPAYFADGELCDCGCGALDPDCDTPNVEACHVCDLAGSCGESLGSCPGTIDPLNNGRCLSNNCGDSVLDDNEACEGTDFGDATCESLGFDSGSLSCTQQCTLNHSLCNTSPEWTCNPEHYAANDGCDCGCNIPDPDCADTFSASCDFCAEGCDNTDCQGSVNPNNNTLCITTLCGDDILSPGERCDTNKLNDITCDDLGFNGGTLACLSDCLTFDTTNCTPHDTTDWNCPTELFADGTFCDCGCGIPDPDCNNTSNEACDFCDLTGSCAEGSAGCPANIDPSNNHACFASTCGDTLIEFPETCERNMLGTNTCATLGLGAGNLDCNALCQFDTSACTSTPPSTWNCSDAFYGADDGCDCGCGAVDPDCGPSPDLSSCDYCNVGGSCDNTDNSCPGIIDPSNIAICQ